MPSSSVTSARAELNNFLNRVVQRGLLDPGRVSEITQQWAGDLSRLPLPFENTFQRLDDDTIHTALLGMQNLNPRWRSKDRQVNEMEEIIATLRLRTLNQLHEKAQDSMERKSRRLAFAFVAGALTLRAWHRLMRDNVITHLLRQTLLGGRGRIPDRDRTERIMRRELGYLARFADDIAAHALRGQEFSAEHLANRSAMYAGTGRAEFPFYAERQVEFLARLRPIGSLVGGIVAFYRAHDDNQTCEPCWQARGYWLPGEGPMPGAVCLGRAHCRCIRILRYRPEIWQRLMRGERVFR